MTYVWPVLILLVVLAICTTSILLKDRDLLALNFQELEADEIRKELEELKKELLKVSSNTSKRISEKEAEINELFQKMQKQSEDTQKVISTINLGATFKR